MGHARQRRLRAQQNLQASQRCLRSSHSVSKGSTVLCSFMQQVPLPTSHLHTTTHVFPAGGMAVEKKIGPVRTSRTLAMRSTACFRQAPTVRGTTLTSESCGSASDSAVAASGAVRASASRAASRTQLPTSPLPRAQMCTARGTRRLACRICCAGEHMRCCSSSRIATEH